jgi:hypothetical protein
MADKQLKSWRPTTVEEIAGGNIAPRWWLDDKYFAAWKRKTPTTEGQGIIWVQKSADQTFTRMYSPANISKLGNGWQTFDPKPLNSASTPESVTLPHTFFIEGQPLPESVKKLLDRSAKPKTYFQKSDFLKFPKPAEVRASVAIAARPLSKGTQVLNALPQDISIVGLTSMDIPLSQFGSWRRIRQKFNQLDLHDYEVTTSPSKAKIKETLLQDAKDTVILVAHNTNGKIHISGSDGDISFEEISQFKRDKAPLRAILLLTCGAGAVNGSSKSLAEIMKANNLATVIYGSPELVDASQAPDILKELHMNTESQMPNALGMDEIMKKYNYTIIAFIYDHFLTAS